MACRTKRRMPAGLLICSVVGFMVLILGILLSKVDLPVLTGEELTDFNRGWMIAVDDVVHEDVTLPFNAKEAESGTPLILTKWLPASIENDTFLFFRASHQNVKAFIDGKEIYSFGWNEQRLFGHSPASAWITVPIQKEYAGKQIQVELTGIYFSNMGRINAFYMGDKSSVLSYILGKRLGNLLISTVLLILGFTMITVALIPWKTKATSPLFRLGVLSVLVGIWSACTSNILQILTSDVFSLLNLEFLAFLLLLPTAFWFLDSFEYYKDKKVLYILFKISVILAIIIHILQLFNIADYMETIAAEHILLGISIIYLISDSVKALIKNNATREVRVLTISVILAFVCSALDIFKFYLCISVDDGFFTRIGMVIFIIIWASEIIMNMSQLLVKMTQTQLLEVLAYQDQMTGLKNRTAFEKKFQEYREPGMGEAYVIEFDMNGLKLINDNYGHAIGDLILKGIADILKNEFNENASVYRIGGDEFCIIAPHTESLTEEIIQNKIIRIKTAVVALGQDMDLNLSLASGYSTTIGSDIRNIDSAFKHADRLMYEDKHQMKYGAGFLGE
ncbi:GGDEF domain-containing protein [Parasporobacterium paucivorans]|uniref:Diguanylate cyclase (GGDEF) domain-containing protein n=1 Tax=Parasporobacterium paucivorans DSM 15970 TaxID=1122934 RepID=A0A1M6K6E3_9FIRM|nr:GGDEF domain-containing protein [Parasporobacterium paucivorans]SHJ54370.1 diguanylate cyclase (GGDEF) domain-containing protein [Parasporobacterium paucivorans DSM 15970]